MLICYLIAARSPVQSGGTEVQSAATFHQGADHSARASALMTSRLKRKLNQSAAEGSSPAGNLLESFVQYGTPLPSLDKAGKKDKNEFVPVWEQTVTDDQGRRRLHGAFTGEVLSIPLSCRSSHGNAGGFSAGYYNTVGSKEGWTPSQFVSSRSAKRSNEQQQQRAEDFMDEEDLADLREADLKKAASDHASKHQQQQGPSKPSDSDEAGDRLLRTIQQSRDSTGVRLLKNMGWKEGQGTGPRLSAAARQRQARELRASGVDHEDWTALAQSSQTFAPLDRPLIRYSPKDDAHGLGWEKGMSLDQPSGSGMHHKQTREGQTDMPLGGAFGISALEDADDDDYSVYDTGNRENESSRRSKLARMVFDEDDAGPPQQKRSEPKVG